MKSKLTIGTRSSKLALWQANHICDLVKKNFPNLEISIKEIKTKGDYITDVALSNIGGKGLFTKEIEDALLNKEIDIAVHSLKDLPTKLPDGLKIGAVLKREKSHDVLIACKSVACNVSTFNTLPTGSKIGTSSLRRVAQLKSIRPDLEYLDLRGNLDTRIRKLEEGEYDGIILAYAGVKRLGFEDKITEHFNPKEVLPAVGQGALAIEIRNNDLETEKTIAILNDESTYLTTFMERSFLEALQGGCQVPIGAYSETEENKITLYGVIVSLDGKKVIRDTVSGNLVKDECLNLGKALGERLLKDGGREVLAEINLKHR